MKKILSVILVICLSISTLALSFGITASGADNNQYLHIKNDVDAARAMSLAFPNYTIPSNAAKITMKVKSSSTNTISNGLSLRTDNKAVVSTNQLTYSLSFTSEWNTIEIDISSINHTTYKSYVFRLLDSANDYYFDDLQFIDASGNVISTIDDYESYSVGSSIPLAGNAWTGTNEVLSDAEVATTVTLATSTTSVTTTLADTVTNKYMHIKSDSADARAMSFSFPNATIPSDASAITMKVKSSATHTVATGLSIRKYTNGTGTDGQINKSLTYTTEWNTITIDISDVSKTAYHSYAIRLMSNANDYYFDDLRFVDSNSNLVSVIEDYEKYEVGSRVPVAGGEWTGIDEVLADTQESTTPSTSLATTVTTSATVATTSVVPTAPTQSGTTNKYLHIKSDSSSPRAMSLAFPNATIPDSASAITMKVKASANVTIPNGISIRKYTDGTSNVNQIDKSITYTTEWNTITIDITNVSKVDYKSYCLRLLTNENDYYYDDLQFVDANGNYVSTIDNYESYEVGSKLPLAGNVWDGINEILVESIGTTQYDVTLDGTATKYDEDAEFIFPTLSAKGVAYTDGTSYYQEGDKIAVTKDLTFTTVDLGISMVLGAAMRYNEVSGIRYCTNIDTDAVDSLRDAGAVISLGTLIGPTDLIGTEELTLSTDESKKVDVEYNVLEWYKEDNFKGIAGSLANIKDKNAKRDFIGRGYATVSFGGVTKTIYADYTSNNIENNTRQIGWIATQIKLDTAEYSTLSDAQKAIVIKYFDLYNA